MTSGAGDAAHPDASADAQPDAAATLCGGKVWLADFSVDPTTIDLNGDSTLDFAMRDNGALGGTLAGDVWTQDATSIRPLDTEPKQDFATRTLVHVRMRNTSLPTAVHGAVAWINFGFTATSFAPVFVDAELQPNGTQTGTLWGKSSTGAETELAEFTFLDAGMHDYYLDIDPTTYTVQFQIDQAVPVSRTRAPLPLNGNDDRWASIDAWSDTDAEYGYLRVEACP